MQYNSLFVELILYPSCIFLNKANEVKKNEGRKNIYIFFLPFNTEKGSGKNIFFV